MEMRLQARVDVHRVLPSGIAAQNLVSTNPETGRQGVFLRYFPRFRSNSCLHESEQKK